VALDVVELEEPVSDERRSLHMVSSSAVLDVGEERGSSWSRDPGVVSAAMAAM
jgi:hypothetical protein